jgi:hypothetical protein
MNKAYIITYDLMKIGQNYEKLLRLIYSYGKWAKLGDSSYIIITSQGAAEIRDHLMAALDNNDKLFVGALYAPAAWTGMTDEVSNWIRNNLK